MKIAIFSAKSYDRRFFDSANTLHRHQLSYFETRLTRETASLAHGFEAVCAFVNDKLDSSVIARLSEAGINLLLLRSASYYHADLAAAADQRIVVTHVPDYSPHSVAEHAVAMMLALNRRIPHAFVRVREWNFSIEGLLGFNMHGKTAGIIGAGQIGAITGRILQGFGCKILAYDPTPSQQALAAGFEFGMLEDVLSESDIVSLHCPLIATTRNMISRLTLPWFKRGAMLINTSRGGLIDNRAAVDALENGRLGSLGIDVYEDEAEAFFGNHSRHGHADDIFSRLISMPNVLATGHQGFFTEEALQAIAETSLKAATDFAAGRTCTHSLSPDNLTVRRNGSRPATA